MRLRWNILVLIALCLAFLPAVPAKPVSLEVPYDRAAVLSYQGPQDCEDELRRAGTACIPITRGTHALDLRILDATGLPVGGTYYVHDADGNFLDAGTFCGAATKPMPAVVGTVILRLEAVNGPLACHAEGKQSTGPATTGIMSIRLR